MLTKAVIKLIVIYQKTLSPDTGWQSYKHPYGFCRFYPHCSEYARLSIIKYGLIKGGFFAIKRLIRCHPFAKGGVDQVK